MTRGQCGSLLLHCNGLAPSTPCRSPGAPTVVLGAQVRVGSSGRCDLPNGEGAPNVRAHDLTQPLKVARPEQGDQALSVRLLLVIGAVLDRDLPLRICGGLAQ